MADNLTDYTTEEKIDVIADFANIDSERINDMILNYASMCVNEIMPQDCTVRFDKDFVKLTILAYETALDCWFKLLDDYDGDKESGEGLEPHSINDQLYSFNQQILQAFFERVKEEMSESTLEKLN
ncbi:MAG: hypothetical protein WBD99_09655 [Thermodesulfobacteriota bacterium]